MYWLVGLQIVVHILSRDTKKRGSQNKWPFSWGSEEICGSILSFLKSPQFIRWAPGFPDSLSHIVSAYGACKHSRSLQLKTSRGRIAVLRLQTVHHPPSCGTNVNMYSAEEERLLICKLIVMHQTSWTRSFSKGLFRLLNKVFLSLN